MVSIGSNVRHPESGLTGEVVDYDPDTDEVVVDLDGAADGTATWNRSNLEEL